LSPEKYQNLVLFSLVLIAILSLSYLHWAEKEEKPRSETVKFLPVHGRNLPLRVPARKKPRRREKWTGYAVALVIDDVGNSKEMVYRVAELPRQVTPSVLPFRKYSLWATLHLKSKGFDVMLHLPMEPQNPELLEKKMLRVNMSTQEMETRLEEALREVPLPVGINNHEGSLFTSSEGALRRFFSLLKGRNLFFLDSWTSGRSRALRLARSMGIRVLRRDVFLDNLPEPDYIKAQWKKLLEVARSKGGAVGIAHARETTLEVLPELLRSLPPGFKLVRVRHLAKGRPSGDNKQVLSAREGR